MVKRGDADCRVALAIVFQYGAVRKGHCSQLGGIVERFFTDAFQRGGESDGNQGRFITRGGAGGTTAGSVCPAECKFAKVSRSFGEFDAGQFRAAVERRQFVSCCVCNFQSHGGLAFTRVQESQRCQPRAGSKRLVLNALHGARNNDCGQRIAGFEHPCRDGIHSVRQRDGCQADATAECPVTESHLSAGFQVIERNGSQHCVGIECKRGDFGHAGGDHNLRGARLADRAEEQSAGNVNGVAFLVFFAGIGFGVKDVVNRLEIIVGGNGQVLKPLAQGDPGQDVPGGSFGVRPAEYHQSAAVHAQFLNRAGQRNARQVAKTECVFADLGHALGDDNAGQRGAGVEGAFSDTLGARGEVEFGHFIASVERIVADLQLGGSFPGENNRGQACATLKSTFVNQFYLVADGDGSNLSVLEGTGADFHYGVGQFKCAVPVVGEEQDFGDALVVKNAVNGGVVLVVFIYGDDFQFLTENTRDIKGGHLCAEGNFRDIELGGRVILAERIVCKVQHAAGVTRGENRDFEQVGGAAESIIAKGGQSFRQSQLIQCGAAVKCLFTDRKTDV